LHREPHQLVSIREPFHHFLLQLRLGQLRRAEFDIRPRRTWPAAARSQSSELPQNRRDRAIGRELFFSPHFQPVGLLRRSSGIPRVCRRAHEPSALTKERLVAIAKRLAG
jgi:hypothetical protein